MSASPGLAVVACGMSTATGLTAPTACAAFRARLDNFTETRFISRAGEWIIGAEVPLAGNWRGVERHVQLLAGPVDECLTQRPDGPAGGKPADIPVLICVAEPERAGRLAGLDAALPRRLGETLGLELHPASRVIAYGQVGGAVALRDAARLIAETGAPAAVVAGVDSFLIAETIRHYDREDRLLHPANSNGFIAGEAGAAALVVPEGRDEGPHLAVAGLGFAAERAPIRSGAPLRGDGMTAAMRTALEQAGIAYNDISYRLADLSGEQYYFKEATLAQARLWRGHRDPEEVWHPADSFGYTGAAVIPILLGVGLTAGRKGYAPGPVALAHAAHDDGRRAAMVLRTEG